MSKKAKITIKPFKRPMQVDPQYAENTWKLLRNAIQEIHKKNASKLSFEELYRNAYNMVLHKYGDQLYRGLQEVLNEHLKEVAASVAASRDESFLQHLIQAWEDHNTSIKMIRDILMYMDRVYVPQHNKSPVYDLGLTLFKENVARANNIKERLLSTVLGLILRERRNEIIDRGLIRSVTQMMIDLGVNSRCVYEEDFERPFLQQTSQFYRAESLEFINSNSCPDYMYKVETRLREEMERVKHYMDPSSENKVRDCVQKELIMNHMESLVNMPGSGLLVMLKDDKLEDLQRMYDLFSKVSGGLNLMKDVLSEYVREKGKEIVNDEEKTKNQGSFVPELLELKDKFDKILLEAFRRDKKFQHALNLAFEYFLNINSKSPEYISLFIDEKLKKGLKGMNEEEVDILLDKVMSLFRFIQDKDVFEKYYKQHLAKRLLTGKSVSDDAERNMISKLKTECGYQFTSKLEGMFNDMRVSGDTIDLFREHLLKKNVNLGMELNVQVLTTGFWPTQPTASCHLPLSIQSCCESFQNFYLSSHNGRRLTWQTNMGTAELKANFEDRRELLVSTYQMCILLLFNDCEILSMKDIVEQTAIPDLDVKRNMVSLVKSGVLLTNTKARKGDDIEKFKVNMKFKSKLYRLKVMSITTKETEPQREVTKQKIDEDRKHQIEACVVRIMKSRKQMEHSQLIAEVTKQLSSRFMPNPIIIKKRIESLIEREYLERRADDRKVYRYLA